MLMHSPQAVVDVLTRRPLTVSMPGPLTRNPGLRRGGSTPKKGTLFTSGLAPTRALLPIMSHDPTSLPVPDRVAVQRVLRSHPQGCVGGHSRAAHALALLRLR